MVTQGWWVLTDIRSVQRYIFETDVLAQMRGASALVKRFDEFVRHEALGHGGEVEIGLGGTHRVRFDSESAAGRFQAVLTEAFERETGLPSTRLSSVVVEETDRSTAYAALVEARSRRVALPSAPLPLGEPCRICRLRSASTRITIRGEILLACVVCKKRQAASSSGAGSSATRPERLRDLGKFAESSRPPGYIAVVVADGDGIGQKIISSNDDQALSVRLGQATEEAVKAAAAACNGQLTRQWVGGDEAVLVVRPQQALTAAAALVRTFSEEATDQGQDGNISMSCGIVVTHASMPFSNILSLGDELLDEAKAARRTAGARFNGGGFIDMEITSSGSTSGLAGLRRERLVLGPMVVTRDQGDDDQLRWLVFALRKLVELRASRSTIRGLASGSPDAWDTLEPELQEALAVVQTDLPRLVPLHELYLG